MLSFLSELQGIGVVGRFTTIFIFSVFFPLTAISYIRYIVPKKEVDYQKTIGDMGINSTKKVSDVHSYTRFFLPVSFAFVICFFAISYIVFADKFLSGIDDNVLLSGPFFGSTDKALIAQSISVLAFSFIGAFIWSATNIIRRLVASDLSPSVYYSAGIRIMMASIVALVLSFMLGEEASSNLFNLKSSLVAIAFLTGMFPERVLQYLVKVFQKFVNPDNLNSNKLSLYRVQGISMQHKERLEEIGIDDAQNLANAGLTGLLIETPYKSRQLLDWIGQAKLICFAPDHVDQLRSVGIRSVFDLFSKNKTVAFLQKISTELEIKGPLLENIFDQVKADEGIVSLHEFMNEVNEPEGAK